MSFFQQEKMRNHFIMIEVFDSQKHIDAYYDSEDYKTWNKLIDTMVISIRGEDIERLG